MSIGYSTCHWCHVMEHESFEDPHTAALLNEHFVSIKVDREERPDIDGVYMAFVTASTGSGGWPMSVFLTPDQKPFYGGTYFPPADRYGMPGFPTLLHSIAEAWKTRKEEIRRSGESAVEFLGRVPQSVQGLGRPAETLRAAVGGFMEAFDEAQGGFGGAPKFPRAHVFSFLAGEALYASSPEARRMTEVSLAAMARGGLFDHLGGGFHRYSTDVLWRVPHFEKMLYDQALLARAFVDAYQLTGDPLYARTARATLDYVLRDLTAPEGGFYSAEDADSADPHDPAHKKEGLFYVWTLQQVESAVGPKAAALTALFYGLKPEGNAVFDPHGELKGLNVLYEACSIEQAAGQLGLEVGRAGALLEEARDRLRRERSRRPRPHRDEKVLTDWNGLMVAALARASRAFDEPAYLQAALKAADFVEGRLAQGGRLFHRWCDGERAVSAFLTDEAFWALACLELYEASGQPRWLERARQLADDLTSRFWDERSGGFYLSAHDADALIVRTQERYDGAVPSGNSAAALVFARLWSMLGREEDRRIAERTLESYGALESAPLQYPLALTALRLLEGPDRQVLIAGDESDSQWAALVRETGFSFWPNQVTLFHRTGEAGQSLREWAPFTAGMGSVGGRPAAYVCVGRACQMPVTDPARLRQIFREQRV